MIVRRGQSARRHPSNGESHTLAEEIREIDDVCDREVSARAAGDADACIEVENVFAPAERVELSGEGWCVLQLGDDSSNFCGVGSLGGDLQNGAQEESR